MEESEDAMKADRNIVSDLKLKISTLQDEHQVGGAICDIPISQLLNATVIIADIRYRPLSLSLDNNDTVTHLMQNLLGNIHHLQIPTTWTMIRRCSS